MSLRTKVLLPLIVFSAVLVAYLTAFWMPRSLAAIEAGYQRTIERHLDSIGETLVPLLLAHELDAVRENLDSLMKRNPDWIGLRLLDGKGRELYPLQSPSAPRDIAGSADVRRIERRISYGDEDLGRLFLRVDLAPRLAPLRRRHWEMLFVLLGCIGLFVASTGIVLDRVVIRPVSLLSHASQKLAGNEFDAPLVKIGEDEVGKLVEDFAGMRNAIRDYRSSLEDAREQLQGELAERKKHEKALADQAKLLEAFFENTLTLNVILDRDFNFIRVNEAYARADNRSPSDFPGRNHFEFYPSDAKAVFERVVETAEPARVFARPFVYAEHPERGVSYWDWTLVPLTDESGRVDLLIFSLNNVTEQQRAQESLRESEARLREAQQIAKIGNWEWDVAGDRLWWSDETYRIFGISPSAFGADFEAFIAAVHPEDRQRVRDTVEEALRGPAGRGALDYRVLLADGSVRFVHEEAKTICDGDGKPQRRVGTVQDITERKEAEEELNRLTLRTEMILNSAGEGIYGTDIDGAIVFMNRAARDMLGFTAPEAVGKNSHALFHHTRADGTPYPSDECPLHRSLADGEEWRGVDEVFWTREGRMFPVEHVNTPLIDRGAVVGAVVVFRDIAERKRAEAEIRKLNEDLEHRVQQRTADLRQKSDELQESQSALMNIVEDLNEKTAELEKANARLQELDRLKSLFIASMSHELRTPLNSIIGFSSILWNEWTGPLTAEQKENLAAILRSGKHLLALINDVIDVSKIEAGKLESVVEEFDVFDVVSEAVQSFAADAARKGLSVNVLADHRTMRGDRRRLLQCLLNLVSNAVKFTERGTIGVRVAASPGGRDIELAVEDTGIGIGEKEGKRLFIPFARLESPLKAKVPGTGLGLYLTRKLVREVLQGDILFSSAPGRGSIFTLRVPVSPSGGT